MAKVFFYYGTMNSSKTANLLMTRYNYTSRGRNVLLVKSAFDTRSDPTGVVSRIGLGAPADVIIPNDPQSSQFKYVDSIMRQATKRKIDVVILDEAQFFNPDFIKILVDYVADALNIPIIAYGLMKDFRGVIFPGSKAWIEVSDKFCEVKTVCDLCGNKATYNYLKKQPSQGNIAIGSEDYMSVCRTHYKELTK